MLKKITTIRKIKNAVGLSIREFSAEIGCHPHHFLYLQNLRHLPTGRILIGILKLIRKYKLSDEFSIEQILDDYIALEDKNEGDRTSSTSRKTSKRTLRAATAKRGGKR